MKKPANYIYFKYNWEIPDFIKNRSEAVMQYNIDTDEIVIDEEKEEEMQLYIASKKYNI